MGINDERRLANFRESIGSHEILANSTLGNNIYREFEILAAALETQDRTGNSLGWRLGTRYGAERIRAILEKYNKDME